MYDIKDDIQKEELKVIGQKRLSSETLVVEGDSKSGHRQLRSAISTSDAVSQDNSKSTALSQPKSKRKALSPNINLSSTVDKFIPELCIRYFQSHNCFVFHVLFNRSDLLEIVRDMQFQAGSCDKRGGQVSSGCSERIYE